MTTADDIVAYAGFCRALGYRVVPGEQGLWIGRAGRMLNALEMVRASAGGRREQRA